MANHFRTDRVGMEIKREVNEILQKKVRDPRVQGVTITDVQMLGDLSVAKVYYTILSNLASDNQKAQIGFFKPDLGFLVNRTKLNQNGVVNIGNRKGT